MNSPKELLGHIPGGKVLDVGTGSGGFVSFLLDGLQDYTEIIGIDTDEGESACFTKAFQERKNVHYVVMDAARMDFPDASFDTVGISYTLHHLPDVKPVLAEMMRVLRPGGYFIIREMYRDPDAQTETQMTHIHLHDWYSAVDRARGYIHNMTYTHQEIIDIVTRLGLQDVTTHELSDRSSDPKEPEMIKDFETTIDHLITHHIPDHPELQQRGREMQLRVREIGFHNAAFLLIVGQKEQVPLS